MRRTLLAALLLSAAGAAGAGGAAAECDRRFRPLCVNECQQQLPDPKDPVGTLFRTCPE